MSVFLDALIIQNQELQYLLNVLLKSFLILGVLLVVFHKTRHRVSSTFAHGLLLTGLICVAILPFAPTLMSVLPSQLQETGSLNVFTITAGNTGTEQDTGGILASLIVGLYGIVVASLLLKLTVSFLQLMRIHAQSQALEEPESVKRFNNTKNQLQIQRHVNLRRSKKISSPVSYGFFRPTVLVQDDITSIPGSVQTEIFIHELSHVKRLDWLTLIFTRLLCSLLWINPMLWIVARKLHDEAEQVCDSAIIETEEDRIRYAESLLNLAKQRKTDGQELLLAQPMYDGGELTMRIKNILEGKISRRLSPRILGLFVAVVVTLSVATSGIRLVAAEFDSDRDYLPTRAIAPQYPTRAAQEGVEGWVLVSFTVRADGLVDPSSVQVVDAEPPGYFENSSRRAAVRFEFEPAIVEGLAVDVPGVQYLFRYQLEPGGAAPFTRPPPQARSPR